MNYQFIYTIHDVGSEEIAMEVFDDLRLSARDMVRVKLEDFHELDFLHVCRHKNPPNCAMESYTLREYKGKKYHIRWGACERCFEDDWKEFIKNK